MNPERFLLILSASLVMIGLISQLQVNAASANADAFSTQFPNVDKLSRQEIADLRRSFAQKTIHELKKQKEANGETDPGLFVMDIKADTELAQEASEKVIDEDEPLAEANIIEEDELLSMCANWKDMDEDGDMDGDEESMEPPASWPKGDEQIVPKKSSSMNEKTMEPTQHKSTASNTKIKQDKEQKEPTSTDGKLDKTQTQRKSTAQDNGPKEEATTKQKSPQKPATVAQNEQEEDKQAETQTHVTDNDGDEDQNSSSMDKKDEDQIQQKSSKGLVKDEDKIPADARLPSPAAIDNTDKEPSIRHESTTSKTNMGGKHKKSSATDKKHKEAKQKKSSTANKHTKPNSKKPSKEEL